MTNPTGPDAVEREIITRAARCGHHFDDDCSSCSSAQTWTDGELDSFRVEIAKLRAALKPFGKAAEIRLCGGDHWTDDKPIQGTDVAFHIKFGDLRRARAALGDRT